MSSKNIKKELLHYQGSKKYRLLGKQSLIAAISESLIELNRKNIENAIEILLNIIKDLDEIFLENKL